MRELYGTEWTAARRHGESDEAIDIDGIDRARGAALGIATGRFTTHRWLERARDWILSVTPAEYGGIKLTFNMIVNEQLYAAAP